MGHIEISSDTWMLIALAFAVSLIVSLIFGKYFIPYMRKKHYGQSIREDGPKWHMSKSGTPTMGGFIFISGIAAASIIAIIIMLVQGGGKEIWQPLVLLGFSLCYGVIGYLDDYVKVAKKRNLGLTAPQKLLLQLVISLVLISLLRLMGLLSSNLYLPILGITLPISWIVYLVFGVLAISGMVNAVNFTDGVDGLLGSVTLPVSVFFTLILLKNGSGSAAVFGAALTGGLIGFLVYNFNPAKVFMGDTGSLFLGGAVCALALAADMPLVLVWVGIIYIVEIISVVLQVGYFKMTHGKRLFKMAPIHHHFEMSGWKEKKICFVFAGITLAICVIMFLILSGRYNL